MHLQKIYNNIKDANECILAIKYTAHLSWHYTGTVIAIKAFFPLSAA